LAVEADATRASDAERERVAARLREHCAQGRLSIDELDARVGRAYCAQTLGELNPLVADLPAEPRTTREGPSKLFWPGTRPFRERRNLDASCDVCFEDALREIVPRMGTAGYGLVEEIVPRRLVFQSDTGDLVTVMFHPAHNGGTEVSAFGHAPRSVRKAFARLSD
jgi:uncharacterized protein DUF1707